MNAGGAPESPNKEEARTHLSTVGYRIGLKFKGLSMEDVPGDLTKLNAKLKHFKGVVFFHSAGAMSGFWNTWRNDIEAGKFAVLFISGDAFELPGDCKTPYAHAFSRSIISVPEQNKELAGKLQQLIANIQGRESLPPPEQMFELLWSIVDPADDVKKATEARQIRAKLREIESILRVIPQGVDEVPKKFHDRLMQLYQRTVTVSELQSDFERLSLSPVLKKN